MGMEYMSNEAFIVLSAIAWGSLGLVVFAQNRKKGRK